MVLNEEKSPLNNKQSLKPVVMVLCFGLFLIFVASVGSLVILGKIFITISPSKINNYLSSLPKNDLRIDAGLVPKVREGESLAIKGKIEDINYNDGFLILKSGLIKAIAYFNNDKKIIYGPIPLKRSLVGELPFLKPEEKSKKEIVGKEIMLTGLLVKENRIYFKYAFLFEKNKI